MGINGIIIYQRNYSNEHMDNTIIVVETEAKEYFVRVVDEINRIIPEYDYKAENKLDAIETANTMARDN